MQAEWQLINYDEERDIILFHLKIHRLSPRERWEFIFFRNETTGASARMKRVWFILFNGASDEYSLQCGMIAWEWVLRKTYFATAINFQRLFLN